MFWYKISIVLSVIHYFEVATCVQGAWAKNSGKCTHGGILSGVFLNAGIRPRNDTIFSAISSMEDCIEKCCKTKKCDLAMKIGKVCHAIRCQDEDSCQISHRRKGSEVRAEIAFITNGEDIPSDPQMKPTKVSNRFSSAGKNHQSTVNKKPTTALRFGFQATNTKTVNTKPVLTTSEKERQILRNVVDTALNVGSAAGSAEGDDDEEANEEDPEKKDKTVKGDDDDDDDDDSGESGSSPSSSGESSGLPSTRSFALTAKDDARFKETKTASKEDGNFVLPNVIDSNAKLPSASRSAIPTPGERLGFVLDSPLSSYSRQGSSNDEGDDDERDSVSFDDDDDVDDSDSDSDDNDAGLKSRAAVKSYAGLKASTHGELATTKSSLFKTTKAHLNVKSGGKTQFKEKIPDTDTKIKNNNFISNFKTLIEQSDVMPGKKEKTFSPVRPKKNYQALIKSRPMQNAIKYFKNGDYDYQNSDLSVANARAAMTKEGRKEEQHQAESKNSKKTKTDASSIGKNSKDFNDVTRAVITKQKSVNEIKISKTNSRLQQMQSKKTGIKRIYGEKVKNFRPETPLQKELSTLFAKETSSAGRSSFFKPSKKSSFEKVQKLQEKRDRKRHRSKSHPSLSFLYTKKFGKNRIKYFIHRFSEWPGWKKDQILNMPQESSKCKRGVTIRGATLRGGILAGDFKTVGIVDNQHACVNSCCKNRRCDVALMLGKECFNVKCYSSNLCGLAPAAAIFDEVTPIITYVRGHVQKRSTDEQDEEIDEDIVNEPGEESIQLLKWLKIFI